MDRTREFHDQQAKKGSISYDEPKRMVRLASVPIYLEGVWRSQAERNYISKQEVINYSISQGLEIVEEKKKGMIDVISRAQISLMEEATDLHMVWKVFTGNDFSLSDGPGEDTADFLGFKDKMSCRIVESITEKTDYYSHVLGIPKTRLYCIFSMVYLYPLPKVPDRYKIPMRRDIATFNKKLRDIKGRVEHLVKTEKDSSKPTYILGNLDDVLD